MEYKKLGDIATYINGYAFKPEDRGNEGLPIIRIQDLTGNSYDLGFYDGEYPEKIEINDGDVLISWSASLGVYVWNRGKALLNQHIFKVAFDKLDIDKSYFVYAVRRKLDEMVSKTHGATMKHIVKKDFDATQIPYPTLEGQAEIASNLDRVSRIIEARKEELEKLDELIKARFVELFGHPDKNENNWKMNTFGDICTVRQGLQIPISKRLTEYEEGCYEYITVQYLHGGKEREYIKNPKDTVICNKDDILMTRTGNTGMVITGVDGVFHNNFFLIDFDRNKYDKDFLVQYLNLDMIQADILRRAGTSTIPDLNHGEFYKIQVFEPPRSLQEEFNDFLNQIDKSKVAVQKALDETQTLFDSLMQEYFG